MHLLVSLLSEWQLFHAGLKKKSAAINRHPLLICEVKWSVMTMLLQLLLEAPDDIMSFKFSPTDPNIIVGGCLNGQVVLWDVSRHAERLKAPRGGKQNATNTLVSSCIYVLHITVCYLVILPLPAHQHSVYCGFMSCWPFHSLVLKMRMPGKRP